MDLDTILMKDPADWTEAEQVFMAKQTDNSLKPDDAELEQPTQSPNWQPNPDEVVSSI